ncbi:MAG: antibiotic biosynthesis monooxygenase [Alphaproteobacteria bacterium]|nr:antibiotic biosynthesis monooxygenase [Alphaproteobacteria bacterium]
MRLSHSIFSLAALGLIAVQPVYAEETVNGPFYNVVYFEVDPAEAAQAAAAARQYAEASRKEDSNVAFEMFQEIARPSRFAVVEVVRDKQAAEAQGKTAAATALMQKLQPSMIGGFGVRPHSGFEVAAPKAQIPSGALYVITHVDVFPAGKDQAAALVKAQADAARKDDGNLRYDVLQWDGHPNHFTLVEAWRDRKAFDAGAAAPHTKEFRQKLTPLEGALYDERLYQAVR